MRLRNVLTASFEELEPYFPYNYRFFVDENNLFNLRTGGTVVCVAHKDKDTAARMFICECISDGFIDSNDELLDRKERELKYEEQVKKNLSYRWWHKFIPFKKKIVY
jgi:hypothetical protein